MSRESRGASGIPDSLKMVIPDLTEADAQFLAGVATSLARSMAPKMSGISSGAFAPVWGSGFFGVRWQNDYVWFQEMGIRPFTMRSLAGKTIPMWIDDPTGSERRKYPKNETRVTASGKRQVLIFRKVAPIGARKTVTRNRPASRGGGTEQVSVPMSYPGAPGRIQRTEMRRPWTTPGRVGGAIAQRHIGVRWRHPGLMRRSFIRQGLVVACEYHGFQPGQIRDSTGRFR